MSTTPIPQIIQIMSHGGKLLGLGKDNKMYVFDEALRLWKPY